MHYTYVVQIKAQPLRSKVMKFFIRFQSYKHLFLIQLT